MSEVEGEQVWALAVDRDDSVWFGTASSGAVYAIVGDFREGAIANFPDGESVEFTFDTLTRKKENLIEVLGELLCGAAPVADKAFCLIAKA